jgi:hypothetical protein
MRMISQYAVRAARHSAETAAARTRELLHIANAQHGAGSRAVLVSSAGQQADSGTIWPQNCPSNAPEGQIQSPAEHSKYARDLVELRRLELRTSCMP